MQPIIITDWQTHSHMLSQIRTTVFVEEQKVPIIEEWDGLDESATHFLVQNNNQPVGCARLLIDIHKGSLHFHIGRVAVLKPFRNQNIGKTLMEFILTYCNANASYPVYLHSQVERKTFYERLGFITSGDVFMDAGIPHITMYWQSVRQSNG